MKSKHLIIQFFKTFILAMVALPFVALQTTSAADAAPEKDCAIMCDKCKTVWVSRPAAGGGGAKGGSGVTIYRSEKTKECAECESAVVNFFKTGKLQEECKACGATMTKCVAPKAS